MGLPDQPGNHPRKGFQRADQEIREYLAAEKTLEQPTSLQAFAELPVPAVSKLLLHFMPGDCSVQERLDAFKGDLASVERHAHAIPAKRGNHAGRIPDEQDMIVDLRLFFKTDL